MFGGWTLTWACVCVCVEPFQDISEAIEDGNMDMLDNSDFVETDIPPPYKMGLPTKQFLSEEDREDIRDWVLTLSLGTETDQTLPTRPCDNCGTDIYEASLSCHNCHTQYPSCIVSGYPIPASQVVSCTACGSRARKAAWNTLLVKTGKCPWCNASQSPVY